MGPFTPQPKLLTGVGSETLPTAPRIYCSNSSSIALPMYLLPQGILSGGIILLYSHQPSPPTETMYFVGVADSDGILKRALDLG